MKTLAIVSLVLLISTGVYLYEDAKEKLSKKDKDLITKSIVFCFLFFLAHFLFFLLLIIMHQQFGVEVRSSFWKIQVLLFSFPILVQLKLFPYLEKNKNVSFELMRIAIEFAMVLSLILLFFVNNVFERTPDNWSFFFLTGVAIYFAASKVLIEFLIMIKKKK